MHHHALALPKGNSSGTHTSHGAWWTSTVWNSSFDGGTKNEKVEEVVKQLRRSQQSSSKRVTRATRSLKESSSFYDFFSVKLPSPISTGRFEGERVGGPCPLPLARIITVGKSALSPKASRESTVLVYQGHWPAKSSVNCLAASPHTGPRGVGPNPAAYYTMQTRICIM